MGTPWSRSFDSEQNRFDSRNRDLVCTKGKERERYSTNRAVLC